MWAVVGGYIEDENGNASYSSPFYGCAALRTVYFSEDLAEIPPALFADSNVAEITIPSTVTSIESGALDQNITILCEEGSAAHRYAEESGINFVLTGEHKHSFGQWQVKEEPTCTEPGIEARTCSCGYEETRQISPLDHDFSEEWTTDKEPTCTEDVGRILRTFKIKKNVEVTDNGKIII